jgi:hypothetical protein
MQFNRDLLEKLVKEKHEARGVDSYIFDKLFERIMVATSALELTERQEDSSVMLRGKKNYIINVVTALEIYLKDMIEEFSGSWNNAGFDKLLKEKITLNEAYDWFKDTSATKEKIVARFASFQNISTINNTFSCLFGVNDFLSDLDAFTRNQGGQLQLFSLKSYPDWKKQLRDMLVLRNKIVHEDEWDTALTSGETVDKSALLMSFINGMLDFALDRNMKSKALDFLNAK